ncbi:hypothetical protein ES332_A11G000600v1 [Gossypium tomentosum]|uniref:Uncharacterized protein n=1 Tax=Gossypium tomentosum TaxID=34277 RepID=A0A5D2N4S1_GOSTO|nr:hypothetical protein ES332_A11G000600v1 [Gossypium tomentosum]
MFGSTNALLRSYSITGLCNEMFDFYSVSSPPITYTVCNETFTLPTLPSPIFSPEKIGRTVHHRSVRVFLFLYSVSFSSFIKFHRLLERARGFLEGQLKSKSKTENVEVNRVINRARASISNCQYLLSQDPKISPSPPQHFASKSSIRFFDIYKLASKEKIEKERPILADELNRGYFDDMSELRQHGGKIALANKILIPGIAGRKFPAVDVIRFVVSMEVSLAYVASTFQPNCAI